MKRIIILFCIVLFALPIMGSDRFSPIGGGGGSNHVCGEEGCLIVKFEVASPNSQACEHLPQVLRPVLPQLDEDAPQYLVRFECRTEMPNENAGGNGVGNANGPSNTPANNAPPADNAPAAPPADNAPAAPPANDVPETAPPAATNANENAQNNPHVNGESPGNSGNAGKK